MSQNDYQDPAWDEYLSTGEDPTGGELEGREPSPRPPRQPQPQKLSRFDAILIIGCIIFFTICLIAPKVREKKAQEEKAKQEEIARQNAEKRHQTQLQYEEIERQKKAAEKENREVLMQERRKAAAATRGPIKSTPMETYQQGYNDGYECGHDDGDCNESYGYSWLDDSTLKKATADYVNGFKVGYKAGFSAGHEDHEHTEGI